MGGSSFACDWDGEGGMEVSCSLVMNCEVC